ncbi:hypothetical protein KCV01_g16614, partial [Aureobasidium melanogenum]
PARDRATPPQGKNQRSAASATETPVARKARSYSDVVSLEGDELFEAIHRSLLAGLPTQVGHKDDKGVFRGTRERRFQVFPGSALAKAPPAWIFAGQILDIGGKVWAMMCARVDPAWIESQGAHLVRSTARDPHWSRKRGTVVAYEQVTLFGLVLVERRPVTFHRQDPALAHEIFVREALVRGDLDSRADFVRANARVLEQAHDIEAKQRRAGLLRSDEALAAFFDGKLPESVADTRALDAWYRKAAPGEQAALRWTLADVMDSGSGLDPKAFPASLDIGQHRYRLEYRFVPGDPADGVTIHVPLAFLNALPSARCEWLVGGLLVDKVAELIRALPKPLRRNFVPAPDFAKAFAEAEAPRDEALAKALATFLKRTTGVDIDASAFADAEPPAHLLMRYRVHDENGRTMAEGRDLSAIRAQWEGRAREAFSRKTDIELTREDIVAWDFEAIPREVRSEGGLKAYPALVDLGEAVALRVFERADEAAEAHVGGVERLLRQALASEFKRARRQLPIGNPLSLKYAPLGSVDGLREDLVEGGFADLLATHKLDVRTQGEFDALRAELGRELFGAAMERQKLAEPIIEAQAELKPWMEPPLMGFAKASYDDLREQLAALIQPGFLRELPTSRLAHFARYLKAMRLRGERLRQDPQRDQSRAEDRRAGIGQAVGARIGIGRGGDTMKTANVPTPAEAKIQPMPQTEAAREACAVLPVAARAEAETVIELLRLLGCDDETCASALWFGLTRGMPGAADEAMAGWAPTLRRLVEGQGEAEKVWALHAQRGKASGAEGLRRLLLAIIRDLRVVFVLLARQLAAMRTAMSLPDHERRELAQLTSDIHAPLANRLGIWQLKWELEDLAFRYLEPDTYRRIARLLDERRADRERFIADSLAQLGNLLEQSDIRADLAGRPKHIFSIWKKMKKKGLEFSDLYDIRAVRILVDNVADCYAALGLVHSLWPHLPGEFDDYVARPKGNGYRSLHTAVLGPEGKTLEVQIRTHEMHRANELGVAAHWRYKEGGGADAEFEAKIAWMRKLLEPRGE